MRETVKRNATIDYLKAFAAVFVVLGHAFTYLESTGGSNTPVSSVAGILVSAVHVPLFFLVSGFLCHRQPLKKYYGKKAKRILIPFFFFTALKLVFTQFVSRDFAHGENAAEMLVSYFLIGSAYWFIYCIFIIYMIAPLFWQKDETKPPYALIAAFAVFTIFNFVLSFAGEGAIFPESVKLFGITVKTPLFQIERVIIYMPYFLAGMLIKRYENKIIPFFDKAKLPLAVICVIIAAACTVPVYMGVLRKAEVKLPLAFALMFLLRTAAKRLPDNIRVLKTVGGYSLQTMLFDGLFRVVLFAAVGHFFTLNALWAALITAVNITLTCLCCTVIKKIPYIRVLFGL